MPPLLFGQSAIQKLGPIQLDGERLTIQNGKDFKSDKEATSCFAKAYEENQAGKYNDAVATSTRGLTLTNNKSIQASLYMTLADAYYNLNQVEKAIDACHYGIVAKPDEILFRYNMGVYYFENNQIGKADQSFELFLRDAQIDNVPLQVIFGAYSYLGEIKYIKKEYPSAENYYLKAIKCSPDITSMKMRSTYCGLARIYEQQGNYDKAINCFNKGMSLSNENLDDIENYFDLGYIYSHLENIDAAITYYVKSVELFYGKYYNNIQKLFESENKYNVRKANVSCYCGSMATLFLGRLYTKKEDYEKAIASYKMIWDGELMRENKQLIDYVFYQSALDNIGDFDNRKNVIKEGLEKYPGNPDLMFEKALMNKSDNLNLYLDILKKEQTYTPLIFDYATVYNNIAWGYLLQENPLKGLPYSGSSDNVRGKHYPNISTKHDRFPEKMFTFAV